MISSLDPTLYLVTDSTPAILGSANLLHAVEEAIKGGVSIVQYRDKHADTAAMITIALELHRITRKYRIPLLINDRVDAAVAVGAEGVHRGLEAPDLTSLSGTLVINMGTVTPDRLSNYLLAMRAYNSLLAMRAYNSLPTPGPIVFDPVGGAAGRRFFDFIKGNENEIKTIFDPLPTMQQRGVDSTPSTTTPSQKSSLVRSLAARERCIILLTGPTDYLSDGTRTAAISNGHPLLGKITGYGCALSTVIASYLAVHREDKFLAVLAAVLHYEIAAERAAAVAQGPGTFVSAFLDQLYATAKIAEKGEDRWMSGAANVEFVES